MAVSKIVWFSNLHVTLWKQRKDILFCAIVYVVDAMIVSVAIVAVFTVFALAESGHELAVTDVEEFRDSTVAFAVAILTIYRLPGPRRVERWLRKGTWKKIYDEKQLNN